MIFGFVATSFAAEPITRGRVSVAPTSGVRAVSTARAPIERKSTIETVSETVENKFDVAFESVNDISIAAPSVSDTIRAARGERKTDSSGDAITSSDFSVCYDSVDTCIKLECGTNYEKCETLSQTIFGDKLRACLTSSGCGFDETSTVSTSINDDWAAAKKINRANRILDCGDKMGQCLINTCGAGLQNCLTGADGNMLVNSSCSSIINECESIDSGIATRHTQLLSSLRMNVERSAASLEFRMNELEKQMETECLSIGALFDRDNLKCVFSINFSVLDPKTGSRVNAASKRFDAGIGLMCDEKTFGVDVSTYKNVASQRTIDQKSATGALLGSGVGMGVGALAGKFIGGGANFNTAETAAAAAKEKADKDAAAKETEQNKK